MNAEAAVKWAWCEELPKAPRLPAGPDGMRPSWMMTTQYGEHLAQIDGGINRYGCVPDMSADRFPHADAVAIADAVFALDASAIEMPEDWRPAPELDCFAGLGSRAVADAWRRMTVMDDGGAVRLKVKPSDLVIRNAILGTAMDLSLDDVTEEVEKAANGRARWFVRVEQHVIVGTNPDGSDRTEPATHEATGTDKRGNPLPGAYQKRFLDPDPVWTIVARAEHEIWHSALCIVADQLAGVLETVEVGMPATSARPWEQPPVRAPRVLPDLVARRRDDEARMQRLRSRGAPWFRSLTTGGLC